MAIRGGIYLHGKGREVQKHTHQVGVTDESETSLFIVCTKAVQRSLKVWDVEDVADENLLPIQVDNNGSTAKDWGV